MAEDHSRFSDDNPWSPYVVISYRYNPADVIGKYVEEARKFKTRRGPKIGRTLRQENTAKSELSDYLNFVKRYEKSLTGAINISKIRSIPDVFVIVVGVVDGAVLHQQIDGGFMDYSDLFEVLFHLGFDPLSPIRRRIKSNTDRLGTIVRKQISSRSFSKDGIYGAIESFASSLSEQAKEYIYGGKKPRLRNATIVNRVEKKDEDPSLYRGSKGIEEPLFETGQLHDAIDFKVFMYQSEEMKEFGRELVSELRQIQIEKDKLELTLNQIKKHHEIASTAKSKYNKNLSYGYVESIVRASTGARTHLFDASRMKGFYKASVVRNVPENPTEAQLRSIQKRGLSFLGMRLIDLDRAAESISKQIESRRPLDADGHKTKKTASLEDRLQKIMSDRTTKGRYILKSIGSSSVSRGGKLDYVALATDRIVKDTNLYSFRDRMIDVAKKFRDMRAAGFSEQKILSEAMNMGVSVGDIRFAKIMSDFIRKYGYEEI